MKHVKSLDFTSSVPRAVRSRSRKCITLPYLGNFFTQLNRFSDPLGFSSAYYCPTILKRLISPTKDRITNQETSGVCRIDCQDGYGVLYW